MAKKIWIVMVTIVMVTIVMVTILGLYLYPVPWEEQIEVKLY